jgi:hypothetical protein
VSVESVAGFRDLLTKVWEVKDQDSLASAFKILAERVHPLALGDVARVREQIERLARKLLSSHRNEDGHTINSIVNTLTKGLGTHDYLISRSEARELLGDQIAPEDPETENLIWQLYQDFANEMSLGKTFDPGREVHAAKAAAQAQLAQLATQAAQAQQSSQTAQAQAAQAAQMAQAMQVHAAEAEKASQAVANDSPEKAAQAAQEAEAARNRATQAQGVAQATAAQANTAQQAAAQAQAVHQAAHAQAMTVRVVLPLAIVESQIGSHVCEREVVISEQHVPMQIPGGPVIGANKVMVQEVVRAEWVFVS